MSYKSDMGRYDNLPAVNPDPIKQNKKDQETYRAIMSMAHGRSYKPGDVIPTYSLED